MTPFDLFEYVVAVIAGVGVGIIVLVFIWDMLT